MSFPPDPCPNNGRGGTQVSDCPVMSSDDFNETADLQDAVGGLRYAELAAGDGAQAAAGQSVTVHYTGWLTDGRKFDSSRDRGSPFTFRLGAGQVIKGWDQGVAGMKVGGRRRLEIPADLGYGARGVGPIPPNSTLVFAVELLAVG